MTPRLAEPRAEVAIVPLEEAHVAAANRLANEAIARRELTRSLVPLSLAETGAWLRSMLPRFSSYAAVEGGELVGFAVLSRFYQRAAYDLTAELTVLVAPDRRRRGIGCALFERTRTHLRDHNFHLALTALFDEPAWLHERVAGVGFEANGTLPAVTRLVATRTHLHLYRLQLSGDADA